jgi:hypothetical protein
MVLKFFLQVKHSQRTEKYIRLTFNSYISEDDFFLEIFKASRGFPFCTNAPYATLMTVIVSNF